MNAEQNIQAGWNFIFNKLLNKKTKLIYDYRTEEGENGAFVHLPTKEEIKNNEPNPCGWFTGMEDCDINGGLMLDAVLKRYSATKDTTMKKYADDLFDGLMANATVSPQKGFLARSRLPEDGVTHYINSSRDQYTHWIDAMLHFYKSDLCEDKQRIQIKKAIVDFAEKAKKDVIPANHYYLLDEENLPALASCMYGSELGCHETCRLPMFYMAAYAVTQEQHWIDAYRATRDWCLEKAEEVKIESYFQGAYSGTFALLQMQISLRLLYDYEEDIAYKERYKILMHRVANGIYGATFEAKEKLKDFAMPHTLPAWRNVPQKFIREEQWSIVGRKVIMRDVYTAAGVNLQALRNVSENIITQCICPDFEIKQEQIDAFTSVVEKISFESPCCFVPTGYCLAWWSLKTR